MLGDEGTAAEVRQHQRDRDTIFRPLRFEKSDLVLKNRLLRSNVSGMFDEYNGHGGNARLNWEQMFARGGVGGIISSFVPITHKGRILPRYAMIDKDDKIKFWRLVGEAVEAHDCRYILQLSHSGRQQDIGGVENLYELPLSSTSRKDYFHGILCRSMTLGEIKEVVHLFAAGAERAKKAGLSGVELHGANGYLITQFLSSGINDRQDRYGGSVENRARFVLEIVRAIRNRVGRNFHLQMKINAVDDNEWLYPWLHPGNRQQDTIEICRILEDDGDGVDAFHISSGSTFPHPRNPPGDFPVKAARRWYDGMLSSGVLADLNYRIFRSKLLGRLFVWYWRYRRGPIIQGINLAHARVIRQHVRVPVICTGGFQHASVIGQAIREGYCDAVSIARPLIANPDLPKILKERDGPEPGCECTYCNKCLVNDLENPLGCYELSRYPGATFEEKYDKMMQTIMQVFEPTVADRIESAAYKQTDSEDRTSRDFESEGTES